MSFISLHLASDEMGVRNDLNLVCHDTNTKGNIM